MEIRIHVENAFRLEPDQQESTKNLNVDSNGQTEVLEQQVSADPRGSSGFFNLNENETLSISAEFLTPLSSSIQFFTIRFSKSIEGLVTLNWQGDEHEGPFYDDKKDEVYYKDFNTTDPRFQMEIVNMSSEAQKGVSTMDPPPNVVIGDDDQGGGTSG